MRNKKPREFDYKYSRLIYRLFLFTLQREQSFFQDSLALSQGIPVKYRDLFAVKMYEGVQNTPSEQSCFHNRYNFVVSISSMRDSDFQEDERLHS